MAFADSPEHAPFRAEFRWEQDLQLYFNRAKASEVAFGDATWHRELVAQLTRL
jgi:hypothetical protein